MINFMILFNDWKTSVLVNKVLSCLNKLATKYSFLFLFKWSLQIKCINLFEIICIDKQLNCIWDITWFLMKENFSEYLLNKIKIYSYFLIKIISTIILLVSCERIKCSNINWNCFNKVFKTLIYFFYIELIVNELYFI
jgi:hypothetical protein